MSKYKKYTQEYRDEAVRMALENDQPIAKVARDLGINEGTLGNWVRQARIDRGERAGVSTSEREELVELRRENARLRMERDLLKRATAFWVKESGQ